MGTLLSLRGNIFPTLLFSSPTGKKTKRWPADLPALSLIPGDGNLFNRKRVSVAHSFSLPSSLRSDMTEILLKRT